MAIIRVRCLRCSDISNLVERAVSIDGRFFRFTCLSCGRPNRRMMTRAIRETLSQMSVSSQRQIDAEVDAFGAQLVDGSVLERWLA